MSFDVSSSTIGWAVFNIKNNKINLFDSGFFKPIKKNNIFENLSYVREQIKNLLDEYNPDEIAIEEIARFMPKLSSANTIIVLALYNRMVGLTVFDHLKKIPYLYNVMTIRHSIKLSKELPKKEEIPELVETILNITLPRKYTKNGIIKSELYDEADAIACGLCHWVKTNNLPLIKITSSKVRKKK